MGYPALMFIDTEVILFPKTSPLARSRPDFGNPSPIEIDAVRGLVGGCDFSTLSNLNSNAKLLQVFKIQNEMNSFYLLLELALPALSNNNFTFRSKKE